MARRNREVNSKKARTLPEEGEQTSQDCDILRWRFLVYVGPTGRTDVQDDLDRLTEYGKALFERHVVYLAGTTSRSDWNEPQAKKLHGYGDLYEIRFTNGGAATRALGYFGPGAGEFTITLIATHKQNVYKPRDALKTADARRSAVETGKATTRPLLIDGENFPPLPEES